MAKDPAFLFYPGDYLRDTQTLSEKTQVSYDRIMCEHMRNICISKQQLKFFTKKLNDEELEELMFVLTEIENGFQISWVAESIDKRRAYSESRRNNRTKKPKKDMKTYDDHMENENEIENKDKKRNTFNFKQSLKNLGIEEKVISQWLKVRKNKKATNTEIAFESIKLQIEKCPLSPNDCIKTAVEHSWSGFKATWVENLKQSPRNTQSSSHVNHYASDYDDINPETQKFK